MFLDEAEIAVMAGKGGNGSASFRREKFIPKGGPDGGDGGAGGHIYLGVKENIHGLAGLAAKKSYRAENGEPGRGKQQTGASGKSRTIDVPPGTLVYELRNGREQFVVDMAGEPQPYRIARGGRGGWGNLHFKSATNQAPRQFTPGTPGESKHLKLVVSHIADVGLVGLPNVGKSTFLCRVSSAQPKVANYPFTTLEPHLGVVEAGGIRFVIADIPGLIAGAAQGKGLGHKFLRHLKRTHVLLHLVDAQSIDPLADYQTVRRELEAYEPAFLQKPEVTVVSRIDTLDAKSQQKILKTLSKQLGPVYALSSQTGEGINKLLHSLVARVWADRKQSSPPHATLDN